MGRHPLNWLRWQARRFTARGRGALALMAVLMTAALALFVWAGSVRQDAARLRAQTLAEAAARPAPGASEVRPRSESERMALEVRSFLAALPPESERFALLGQVTAIAQKHGVLPQQAEYRWQGEPLAPLVRYQVSMPLSGRYAQVEKFLLDTQARLRTVAVERISISRDDTRADVVEARVVLTLVVAGADR